jgi:cell division septal protein FtsQ
MQLHIHKKTSDDVPQSGYAPLHKALPLEEIDEIEQFDEPSVEETEQDGWRTSKLYGRIGIAAAVILIGLFVYLAAGFRSGEHLNGVRVEGTQALKRSEIVSLAKLDSGELFYGIDLKDVEMRVAAHPLIERVAIKRESHPNIVVIKVTERVPLALIRTSSGEPAIVDNNRSLFWPKRITGLRDPEQLLKAPLLAGVTEKDTTAIRAMTDIVEKLFTIDDGLFAGEIAEIRRTENGSYVIYTQETMTPVFLGSLQDRAYNTAYEMEQQTDEQTDDEIPYFDKQLHLLAKVWKARLKNDLRFNKISYVDARYADRIVVKQ